MSVLGNAPYSFVRGDGIHAKVSSTNAVSRTSESTGNGAIFTDCPNGVPDTPVALSEMTGFKTSSTLRF